MTKKHKPEVMWVPTSEQEVEQALQELATMQRDRLSIEQAISEEVARLRENCRVRVERIDSRSSELTKGIAAYCQVHRDALTDSGKVKTHKFTHGLVKWRLTPWAAIVTGKAKVETVLAALKERGLTQFIRSKEELNKELLVSNRMEVAEAEIPNLEIQRKEEFVIETIEQSIEVIASSTKITKVTDDE